MSPLRSLKAAVTPATPIGEQHYVATRAQRIRVNIRHGSGVPLVLCNGIGASLEVLDPLVEWLDPDSTVIRFDVPGTGGSPTSVVPYGVPYLASVLGRVLSKLGIGVVDVLGISWGGALAQVRFPEPAPMPPPGARRDQYGRVDDPCPATDSVEI